MPLGVNSYSESILIHPPPALILKLSW